MLKTIAGLQNVAVLSKDAQKKIGGGTSECYVLWQDGHISGYYGDNAYSSASTAGGQHWCCASCGTATWMKKVIIE
jgi:hypothetical protein